MSHEPSSAQDTAGEVPVDLRYRTLIEQIPAVTIICEFSPDAPFLYVSPQIERMLGFPASCWVTDQDLWSARMHPDDRERVLAAEVDSFHTGTDYENEFRMIAADGRVVWVWERDNVIRDERGQPICSQGVLMDITQLRGTQRALSESEERAQRYLDVAATMIVVLDERGEVSLVNRRACEVLGYDEDELTGSSWFGLVVPAYERAAARELFGELLSGDVEAAGEHENHVVSKSGEQRLVAWRNTILRDASGRVTGTLSSGEDITERHRAQERVAYLAYHDPLTGLPNRARLAERIAASVARAQHTGASVGLLCLDVDDFKLVNDSLGHVVGDKLLAAVAKRLAATGRHDDMLDPGALAAKCLDNGPGALDPDRRHQDGQTDPGGTERREVLLAALQRADETDRVQQAVGQRFRPGALLHLVRLIGEAARPKEPLKERERREERQVLAGGLAHRRKVVADERGQTESHVQRARIRGTGAASVRPRLAAFDAFG